MFSVRPGSEVGRADQSGRADDFQPRVRDVSLGVKFVLAVDAALDLARTDGLDDGRDAGEKVVLFFLGFEAVDQAMRNLAEDPAANAFLRSQRNFVAHQDANVIDLLPFVFSPSSAADLEIAGGDVDALGELAPVVEVA